jgi:hypothetical protein
MAGNPLDPNSYTPTYTPYQQQSNPYAYQGPQQPQSSFGSGLNQAAGGVKQVASAGKMGGNLISKAMGEAPGQFGASTAGQVLGKAIPIAGAVQGTLGLINGGSLAHNLMSGAETGASIGSIVPGLGTLIGGGIGLGVGALRSLFHGGPSQQEIQGRGAQQQGLQSILSAATDQDRQDAQQAMSAPGSPWKNANDPLALIVMRNQLIKNGMSGDDAVKQSNQMMTNMWNAEKQGTPAVAQAFNPIYQSFQ